jgi:hypothetical protein
MTEVHVRAVPTPPWATELKAGTISKAPGNYQIISVVVRQFSMHPFFS